MSTAKYAKRVTVNQIKLNDLVWTKNLEPEKSGAYKFYTYCRKDCGSMIKSYYSAIPTHTGFCRSCGNKKENYKEMQFYKNQLRRREEEKKEKEKSEKERSFGDRLKEWDNSLDNTVRNFNRIFNQVQGGDQDDVLEILEPYTHLGREMVRIYKNGKKRSYRFLFEDENESTQGRDSSVVYDVWDKNGTFLHTYRGMDAIARDYDKHVRTIGLILNGESKNNLPVTIKQRRLC